MLQVIQEDLASLVVRALQSELEKRGEIRLLGRGAFAQCFLEVEADSVHKVLLPRLRFDSQDRLVVSAEWEPFEIAVLKRMNRTPGFPMSVRDSTSVLGFHTVEMGFEGQNTFTSLVKGNPLSQGVVVERGIWLADLINKLHDAGYLHLDLAYWNIVARDPDGPTNPSRTQVRSRPYRDPHAPHLCVLDFGLSVPTPQSGDDLSEPILLQGWSVGYGAPELLVERNGVLVPSSENATYASDVYSLGAFLYFCLVGEDPYPVPSGLGREQIRAAAKRQQEQGELDPVALGTIKDPPGQNIGLRRIIEKMLAGDPGKRYQSMLEVLDALAPSSATRHIDGRVQPSKAHLLREQARRCPPPRAYLGRQSKHVAQTPVTGRTRVPRLETLFTGIKCLPVSPPLADRLDPSRVDRSDESLSAGRQPALSKPDPDDLDAPPKDALPVADAIKSHRRLAILGKGGIGKTTVTRQLVLSISKSWSDDPERDTIAWSPSARELVSAFPRWIPFRVVLRDFADWVRRRQGGGEEPKPEELAKILFCVEDIRSYLVEELLRPTSADGEGPRQHEKLGVLLQTYPSLTLFDGLDEIPGYEETKGATARASLARAIVEFSDWLDQLGEETPDPDRAPPAHVVVTCRPEAFIQPQEIGADLGEIGRLEGFCSTSLCGLGDDQIRAFVELHLGALLARSLAATDGTTGPGELPSLADRILGEPRLRAVARVPLILRLVVEDALVAGDMERSYLPHSIAGVLDRATERLIREWEQERRLFEGTHEIPLASIAATLQLTPEQLRHAVERMAFRSPSEEGEWSAHGADQGRYR
ncbi:MAG: hypothetical protein R3E97_19575 [Candidatus Eisenbacteria bacterium]